jgi:glycosyltransferase involved in cell wall biosynthesis
VRVAIVSPYPYSPQEESIGGVNQAVCCLVAALERDGRVDLDVVSCSPHLRDYTVVRKSPRLRLHFYPAQNPGFDTLLLYSGRRREILRILNNLSPDLVHVHESPGDIMAVVRSGWPHVVTVHGLMRRFYPAIASRLSPRQHVQWLVPTLLETYSFRRMQNLIAISAEIESVARLHNRRVRVFRMYNPIAEEYFALVPAAPRDRSILFSGLITRRKGVDVLLQAMSTVRKRFPDVTLRLAGGLDWEPAYMRGLLQRFPAMFSDGSAHFIGLCDRKQMIAEYQRATLVCLPSRAESAPMVIAEAMAVGRPVVATRVGGVGEMVEDGVTGRLCSPDDPEGLAQCLVDVLQGDALRETMGEQGRQLALERHHPESVARRTVEIYSTILDPGRSRADCNRH